MGGQRGHETRDPATSAGEGRWFADYTAFLDAAGLRGARVGVARTSGFGTSPRVDAIMEEAIRAMREAGATVVDPADIPTQAKLGGENETTVLRFDFKQDLAAYLTGRTGVPIRTLADAIAFNLSHAAEELAWFGQERFVDAEATTDLTDPRYLEALAQGHALSREQGIDAILAEHQLDALVAPTGGPAWMIDLVDGDRFTTGSSTAAAQAGYPIVTVPAGFSHGLPVGVSFIGPAWSEPTLIRLAYAFERCTQVRRRPSFVPTIALPAGTAG